MSRWRNISRAKQQSILESMRHEKESEIYKVEWFEEYFERFDGIFSRRVLF